MILLAAALAAASTPLRLPDKTPVFCLSSKEEYIPVRNTDVAALRAAFLAEFNFNYSVAMTGPETAVMRFKGGVGDAETISYDIAPLKNGGIGLLAMRTRLKGVSETLVGDEMCWRTFSFVSLDADADSVED